MYSFTVNINEMIEHNKNILAEVKSTSKEVYLLSKEYEQQGLPDFHNKARAEINKKYGKGWRETLNGKLIYNKYNSLK
jgi:hypothetical protein